MDHPIDEIENTLKQVEEQVIFCGHSHVQRLVHTNSGKIIINPGSVGLPAYEDQLPIKHKMESGSPHARYAIIRQNDVRNVIIEFICVSYDWNEAANLASLKGRRDWAEAIKTGRV